MLSITLRLSPRSLSGSSHASKIPRASRVVGHVPAVGRAGSRIVVQIHGDLVARGRVGQMLLDVGLSADEADLLAAPDRDADRAARMRADRLQNAHRLDRGDGAVGVVGRAGRGWQRIEMRADEHDLVRAAPDPRRESRRSRCSCSRSLLLIRGAQLEPQLRRHAGLHHPHDHVVVLGHHHHGRHRIVGRAADCRRP